ncbi:sulfite exporter TauE/SafE family protein [Halomicroarcula sp. F13]|uniref:Probable membrane transporter protein n=1 Tax=Haloarcula rubra TaxID=2487747 RepID=A0AAW4PYA5_9EURY|nr:sulfite exporter TauE/SafE family protein [Halomicroarcula rubra]MBX0325520.1 sulfite exporter TauE/SafE family protein [Halomicroarcula rubra]
MEVPVDGNRFVVLGTAGAIVMAVVSGQLSAVGAFPMEQFLAHWWVFPASIAFATVALSSGVSGALFFSPFFMLVVGLTPSQAIGAGLLTEVFGMGNGLRSYVKQRIVDFQTAKWLLAGSVPAIVVGAFAAHFVDPTLLKLIFGAGLLLLGGFLVYYESPERCEPGECEGEFLKKKNTGRGSTEIKAADGESFRYDTCWRPPGVALSTVGGFVTGLISAGLPEIVTTQLIVRCRIPPRVAVATSVFVLGITAVAGAVVHALTATPVWYVVAWSIPGVLIGGTIGTRVGKYVPSELMETGLGVVFAIVGGIVLALELVVG